jgi:hypothetical protein
LPWVFERGKRGGVAGIAVALALVSVLGFAAVARANTYQLYGPLAQRQGSVPGAYDYAEVGPQFEVTESGTSDDTYVCPSGQSISNWVVVADQIDSFGGTLWQWSSGSGNQINIHVTNWNPPASAPNGSVLLQVAGSCTTNPSEFPYDPGGCFGDFCPPSYPPGDYLPYWKGQLNQGNNGPYDELVKRAFCWSSTFPGCAQTLGARKVVRRFALHNGSNSIALAFRPPSFTRPPALRLSGAAGCVARRMDVSGQNRSGQLRLALRCRGLKRGAAVRVRFVKPVGLSFRLRRGTGSIRVRLAKPPGTVRPLMYLAYGRANKSCSKVSSRLRLHTRTFDLRVGARCGRAAGNAVAHLFVGGLLP